MNKFKRTLSGAAENKVIDEDYKDCDEGGNPITARFSDDLPKKMVAWIDSKGVTIFMTVLTIFVLWGDDLRVCAFTYQHDVYFNVLFLGAMVRYDRIIIYCTRY